MSQDVRRKSATVAILSRHHRDDVERINNARKELAYAKAEDYVAKIVALAPPLTETQRSRLRTLLAAGGDDG